MANIQIKDLPEITALDPNDIIHINKASSGSDHSIIFSVFVGEILGDYKATNTDVINEVDNKFMTPQKTAFMLTNKVASFNEAVAGTTNTKLMTPLRVRDVINNVTATTSSVGTVELATDAETIAGTDTSRAVTPKGLASKTATESRDGIVRFANEAQATAAASSTLTMSPLRSKSLINSMIPNIADKDYRDVLSSGASLDKHQTYHIKNNGTFTLPNTSGLSAGTTVVLTKDIDVTPNVRVFNLASDRIRVGRYDDNVDIDTEVIFDINCEIIIVYNGTQWEI